MTISQDSRNFYSLISQVQTRRPTYFQSTADLRTLLRKYPEQWFYIGSTPRPDRGQRVEHLRARLGQYEYQVRQQTVGDVVKIYARTKGEQ